MYTRIQFDIFSKNLKELNLNDKIKLRGPFSLYEILPSKINYPKKLEKFTQLQILRGVCLPYSVRVGIGGGDKCRIASF